MRVALNPVRRRPDGESVSRPQGLLAVEGARVIVGCGPLPPAAVEPIAPTPHSLFGPRGLALAGESGPLAVADTGHHRLLIWKTLPARDSTPADLVIGQPDFNSEGRNAHGPVGPATLNVPTGVVISAGVLAVADAWNHRVLIWRTLPTGSNQPADIVLGQEDATGALPNRGREHADASSLNWCYGVAIEDGALYVADTGNRRVLKWNSIPDANGAPADLVLGQSDFATRDENGGRPADASGMRWPHAIAVDRDRLLVADAGNNRIMVWTDPPRRCGAPASFVLGQRDTRSVDHNQTAYYPTASSLNMPYGLAKVGRRLAVADAANCRLIGFDLDALAMGASACRLAGQERFEEKGENRWGPQERDSLCWPYGVAAHGGIVAIADSGNNRVLIWEAAK